MLKPVAATFALGILAYSAPAGPAEQIGTTSCERRDAVLDYLSTKYAEAPVALGVTKKRQPGRSPNLRRRRDIYHHCYPHRRYDLHGRGRAGLGVIAGSGPAANLIVS